jgi:hypothetical protein
MTVGELQLILTTADSNMQVMIGSVTHLGMFAFMPVCPTDTGEIELGPPDEHSTQSQGKIFAIMPHGLGVEEGKEDEDDEENDTVIPEMN